jgi:hypothetical protein
MHLTVAGPPGPREARPEGKLHDPAIHGWAARRPPMVSSFFAACINPFRKGPNVHHSLRRAHAVATRRATSPLARGQKTHATHLATSPARAGAENSRRARHFPRYPSSPGCRSRPGIDAQSAGAENSCRAADPLGVAQVVVRRQACARPRARPVNAWQEALIIQVNGLITGGRYSPALPPKPPSNNFGGREDAQ